MINTIIQNIIDSSEIIYNKEIINQWDSIVLTYNKDFIKAIESKDINIIKNFFKNKTKNSLCEWGYDNNDSMTLNEAGKSQYFIELYINSINYLLKRNNMNSFLTYDNFDNNIEEALNKLDIIFDFKINFGDFEHETKLYKTTRGNMSPRKLWALIYLWFVKKTLGDLKDKSILEIGGGGGYVAYFAYLAGVREFIIIDISTTQINQYWNLCHLINCDNISLNELNSNKTIKLLSPNNYSDLYNKNINLVANFDGIVEYGLPIAYNYFENYHKISNLFLSINHEDNYLYNNPGCYNSISYTFYDFYSNEKIYKIYLNKYEDLKQVFLKNEQDKQENNMKSNAIHHYTNNGKNEKRTPNLHNPNKYELLFTDYSDKSSNINENNKWRDDHSYRIHVIKYVE